MDIYLRKYIWGMPQPQIQIEELDSLPIILSLLKKMDIIGLIDANFIPHKNWRGLSIGETFTIWCNCYLNLDKGL
jgi:hypothetical protein